MNSDLGNLFEFMGILQKLKENKRWENTETFIKKESVADHIWRVLIINYVVYKNLDLKLDFLRIIKLVLVHDLVEAIAGDTDYNLVYLGIVSKDEKHDKELKSIEEIKNILGGSIGNEIYDLWMEYENGDTNESKIVKALEKIEATDHAISFGYKYINIPDKFATYCDKAIAKFPDLNGVYDCYKIKLKEVFIEGNFEWKDSYNTKGEFKEFKNFEKIYSFFQVAQKLKETKRFKTLEKDGIKETVAEHSFRLTFFVWLVVDILNLKIDLQRALEIAMFHDIVESITGDIDYKLVYTGKVSTLEKNKNEKIAMNKIIKILPYKIGKEIYELWDEYEKYETKEGKIVKALDKIEPIDHLLRHGLDYVDDPDRYLFYLNSSLNYSSEIKPIFELYKEKLINMYEEGGLSWDDKFDIKT